MPLGSAKHKGTTRKRAARKKTGRKEAEATDVDENLSHTFHFFNKLPPELRLKIWDLVPSERVIEMIFPNRSAKPSDKPETQRAHAIPHKLLTVCKEFRSNEVAKARREPIKGPISFDPEVDTAFLLGLDRVHLDGYLSSCYLSGLRRLAIEYKPDWHYDFVPLFKTLQRFSSLESVSIVLHDNPFGCYCHRGKQNNKSETVSTGADAMRLVGPYYKYLKFPVRSRDNAIKDYSLDLIWFREKYPEARGWKVPDFKVKAVAVGGKRCRLIAPEVKCMSDWKPTRLRGDN
jgi:hypothetical protein